MPARAEADQAYRGRVRQELEAERDRIARSLMLGLAALGLVAYVPSAWLGLREGAYGIVALDTLLYIVLLILIVTRPPPRIRNAALIGIPYVLGTVLSVALGPIGAGPFWLAAAPLVASVLTGPRKTLAVLSAVFATAAIIAAGHALHWIQWNSPPVGTALWLVLIGNALVIGGGLALAITVLVQRLRSTAEANATMAEHLDRERTRILEAQRRLEEEERERRRAEDQLRRSEKLNAIGTLAAGIAHDFNNLLTPVLAAPDILRDPSVPAWERSELLDQVEVAAAAGRELIRRILAFSRPTAEDRDALQAGPAVREAVRLLRATLPGSVTIDLDIDDDTGHILLAPGEMHQIVLNLGSNAHKAMPEGGRLSFHVEEVDGRAVSGWPDDAVPERAIRLRTTDTGVGMDEETRRRVLEPFFTTDTVRGTGLGLATVDGIVRSAGGVLRCRTQPGQGTTFTIYFPVVAPPQPGVEAPAAAQRATHRGGQVLIVDDEESIRELCVRSLDRMGFTTLSASSGRQALDLLQQEPEIGTVITDLNMPEMKGTGLAAEIRDRWPDTTVILMSGIVDAELSEAIRDLDIDAVLAKPFRIRELVAILEEAGITA